MTYESHGVLYDLEPLERDALVWLTARAAPFGSPMHESARQTLLAWPADRCHAAMADAVAWLERNASGRPRVG